MLAGIGLAGLCQAPDGALTRWRRRRRRGKACLSLWQKHTWFAWMVIVAVQIPLALGLVGRRSAERGMMGPSGRRDKNSTLAAEPAR